MTNDDVIYRSRLRLFALAKEMGSVRAACRMLGVHHSTYYRWRRLLLRYGPELLRPRERRQPRMPNAISPMVEQRILAMAIAFPGWGPNRISLELGRPKWGGIKVSSNGVWRLLRRNGLGHRAQRLALVCGFAAPPEPERRPPLPDLHSWTVSTSAGCRGPRAWSGNTRRSMSPAHTPGLSYGSRPRIRLPSGRLPWPVASLASWPRRVGGSRQ